MTDVKVFQGGNITYWWVPAGGIANINSPTAAEINAGTNISAAVAADGTEVTPTDSSDIDDRSIVDAGNVVDPGFGQFNASFTLFRPASTADVNDPYVKAYNLFKTQRVGGYIVKRRFVAYGTTATAGDRISVFQVLSDHTANDTAGEDSVKLIVPFLPQGNMVVNTFVKTALAVTVTPSTTSIAVAGGGKAAIVARLGAGGTVITQGCTWTSSDPSKATVSENGVIKAVAAGSATVTASHPAATTPGTVTVTVT